MYICIYQYLVKHPRVYRVGPQCGLHMHSRFYIYLHCDLFRNLNVFEILFLIKLRLKKFPTCNHIFIIII